jgi:uncharacterized protein (DUF2225 family)
MAKKKKKSVELSEQNIRFEVDRQLYKAIRYYPTAMSLDVMEFDKNGSKIGMTNIPFAHIPKGIKKMIKPS